MSAAVDVLRTAKLQHFLQSAIVRGYDRSGVISRSRADLSLAGCVVNAERGGHAFSLLAESVPDDFGAVMGRAWSMRQIGMLSYAFLRSECADTLMRRHARCVTFLGLPYFGTSTLEGTEWGIGIDINIPMSERSERLCIEEAFSGFDTHWRGMTGQPLPLVRVELAANMCSALFETMFAGQVRLAAGRNRLVLNRTGLRQRVSLSDSERGMFARMYDPAFAAADVGNNLLVRGLVAHMVSRQDGFPDLETAARELGMSKRSLNRRLEEAGTCYRTLYNRHRLTIASELLKSCVFSIKEVAHMVGYLDCNSLMRSFRRFYGVCIGEWRDTLVSMQPYPS